MLQDSLFILEMWPWFFVAISILLGLVMGSFLNVVIYRFPKMLERAWKVQCIELYPEALSSASLPEPCNIFKPLRSFCPSCKNSIKIFHNIPIISYLILKGRCAYCQSKINARYPLVELLTSALTGVVAWKLGFSFFTLFTFLFVWILIALTFIDLDTYLLPDQLTLSLLWLGLIFNLNHNLLDLSNAVVGAIIGYLFLWMIYWIFKIITKKEGMGYGDFKLLAAIGAWFGWKSLPMVILLSAFFGTIVGISLICFGKTDRNMPIPFGPYLSMAGFIVLLWGVPLKRVLGWV